MPNELGWSSVRFGDRACSGQSKIGPPCKRRYYSRSTVFCVHALFLTGSVNLAVAAVVWSLTSLSTCVAGSHNKRLWVGRNTSQLQFLPTFLLRRPTNLALASRPDSIVTVVGVFPSVCYGIEFVAGSSPTYALLTCAARGGAWEQLLPIGGLMSAGSLWRVKKFPFDRS